MEVYIPTHFCAEEVVDPWTFDEWEDPEECFELLNPQILRAADWCREEYGSVTINDWKWGGNFKWSGYRWDHVANRWYSPTSQHSFGCALDLKFKDMSADEVRADLKKRFGAKPHPYISRVESEKSPRAKDNMDWVHIDCKSMQHEFLYFFKP